MSSARLNRFPEVFERDMSRNVNRKWRTDYMAHSVFFLADSDLFLSIRCRCTAGVLDMFCNMGPFESFAKLVGSYQKIKCILVYKIETMIFLIIIVILNIKDWTL